MTSFLFNKKIHFLPVLEPEREDLCITREKGEWKIN